MTTEHQKAKPFDIRHGALRQGEHTITISHNCPFDRRDDESSIEGPFGFNGEKMNPVHISKHLRKTPNAPLTFKKTVLKQTREWFDPSYGETHCEYEVVGVFNVSLRGKEMLEALRKTGFFHNDLSGLRQCEDREYFTSAGPVRFTSDDNKVAGNVYHMDRASVNYFYYGRAGHKVHIGRRHRLYLINSANFQASAQKKYWQLQRKVVERLPIVLQDLIASHFESR